MPTTIQVSEHYDPIPDVYASELVGLLLAKNADERPTAEQALALPVLQPYSSAEPLEFPEPAFGKTAPAAIKVIEEDSSPPPPPPEELVSEGPRPPPSPWQSQVSSTLPGTRPGELGAKPLPPKRVVATGQPPPPPPGPGVSTASSWRPRTQALLNSSVGARGARQNVEISDEVQAGKTVCKWKPQIKRASARDIGELLLIHQSLGEARLEANLIILNATVHACEKGDRWSYALSLLSDARKRALQWDAFSCGSAVNSCEGLWQRAFLLLQLHVDAGFLSQHVPTTSATRACATQAAWRSALQLQESYAASAGQKDLVLGNAAIQAISGSGRAERAEAVEELWEKTARLVYQLLRQSLQVNARTYLPAMRSYSPERWPAALQLLLECMEAQISGNLLLSTSVVSACGSSWQRALLCFRETKQQRLSADVVMYNSALSACAEGGEWECALCLLKEIGDVELERSIVSYNAAINACAAGGQWLLAVHILEIALKSGLQGSLASFTATMDACAYESSKRWESVLRLFLQLSHSFIDLDAGAVGSAINACNHSSLWTAGLNILSNMQKTRLRAQARLCNAALRAWQSVDLWHSGLQLFAEFQAQHVLADAIGVNVMTNALTAGAQWRRSIRAMRHLLNGSLQANEISYSSLVRATEITDSWRTALKYLVETREESLPGSAIQCNAVISACASREAWEWALLCFSQMTSQQILPDIVSYNSAMNACVQAEEWQRALCLLQHVCMVRLQCSLVSYNSAMSACASGSQWQLALCFLALLQQLRQADVFSYSAAMAACDSGKQQRRVVSLLAELRSEGLQESVLPFTSAINVCAKGRDWEPALTMLAHLRCRALQRNVVCHNAALGACRGDHWQKAFHLQQSLCRASLQPNAITCSSTISALETVGQWEWALHLSLRRGVHANRMAVSAAIRSCGGKQWEWALALLEMLLDLEESGMAGMESDVVVYNACLSVFQVAAQWQHALSLLGELQKRCMEATVQTFAAAVGACERGLLAQEAVSLIENVESTAWPLPAKSGQSLIDLVAHAFARHDTTGLGELSPEQFATFLQSLSVGLSLREDDLLDLPPASSAAGAKEAEADVARRMCPSTWKHPLWRCSASAIDLTDPEGSSASELPMPWPPGQGVQLAPDPPGPPGPPGQAHRQLRQGLLAATMQRLRFRAVVTRCGRTRGRKAWQKDTLLLRNVVATSPDLPQKIHTDHVWLKALLVLVQVCHCAMPNSASEP
ncbi:unnamed protein product [Symbiodinium sp. CCMP2592]|nr:unnamed protein product [Symbiodinium sp. CCMP2592]